MKRSDSILANFYNQELSRLPAFKNGGKKKKTTPAKKAPEQKIQYIDLEDAYDLDPFSREGIEKARELTRLNPNTRIVCDASGCSEIAVNAAEAYGYDYNRGHAWDLGNKNPVVATNPVYNNLVGKGILPDPQNYSSPASMFKPGSIIGLNRRNNLVGTKATNRDDADDSWDYANQSIYPKSRGYEHVGYMLDDKTMLHGTGAGHGYPAFYTIDSNLSDGVQLGNLATYQPVETIQQTPLQKKAEKQKGNREQTINPVKRLIRLFGFKNGGMITDPRGQWKYPGMNTRIPGGNITMQGVPYPVLAKANNGMTTMMQPGQDYYFPGADYVDEYPMMSKGGLVKYQVGGDEATSTLKSFINCNKIRGCSGGVNGGVGSMETSNKGTYVPLSNAPVTWEELQVYNETNPKSKEFKAYLKNLQSQFPGLTAQQLLAAGADSARVNLRKMDLQRYDKPAEQTYDRAYHMFYRPLMNQQGRVTIPQILQHQPGGFFNFEQNVRGNYGKKKGQMGLQVEEDFTVQDPNQERLDMGMRPNVPLDESLEAGSRDSDEFLRNWYAGRVDDPRYGEIASKRIEEIPKIQVKKMKPRFTRKGYAAYYTEGTKNIYLNPNHPFSRGSSTQAHEKKHLLYHQVPQQNQEDIIKQKLVDQKTWNERNPEKANKENWGYGYYSDPTEVAARLAEFRMRYNLDPRKKYTADDMKAIMDAHQRRGGKGLTKDEATSNTRSGDRSVDELYEMLGNDPVRLAELNDEIVMNRRQMSNAARYGGDISIPNLRQAYYPMAYGGPMVRYMAGKMTGPNIF